MVKLAKDLTLEERWKSAAGIIYDTFWSWFKVVDDEYGYEKAVELAEKLGREAGEAGAKFYLDWFKVDEMDVPLMSQAADVFHVVWDFKAPWTIESPTSGFERVEYCPRWDRAPEKYKKLGTCMAFCNAICGTFYPKMSNGRATVTRPKYIPKGDRYCIVKLDIK